MDRKKELKEQFKNLKPQRGIVAFIVEETGKNYLTPAMDVRVRVNSLKVRLNGGMYNGSRNGNLQKDWKRYGEEGFTIRLVEELDYKKDDTDQDCQEELEMMLDDWLSQDEEAERIL